MQVSSSLFDGSEFAQVTQLAEADNLAAQDDDGPRPWKAVDLEPVLSQRWQPPVPTVGQRHDGVGIFYPGKVHTIASESEAGKTWLVVTAVGSSGVMRRGVCR